MLTIGTDCSGMEAPIFALRQLGCPFSHEFACDKDRHCRTTIEANTRPKQLFSDITTRPVSSLPRSLDIYVAGFPCQPFSTAGLRAGLQDQRSNIFLHCLAAIVRTQPKCFILENVRNLVLHDQGKTWTTIQRHLQHRLKNYHLYHKVLNTKDFGLPQNRERLYIVGIRRTRQSRAFEWPDTRRIKLRPLQQFVDHTDTTSIPWPYARPCPANLPPGSLFIAAAFLQKKASFPNSATIAPCLVTNGTLWCVPYHRKANVKEYLKLQGFPASFKQRVSDRQLKKQVGNSMSVPVIKAVLAAALRASGLAHHCRRV